MILIQNGLRFMCYFITFSSFYYRRKDIHAFRIALKHTSYDPNPVLKLILSCAVCSNIAGRDTILDNFFL